MSLKLVYLYICYFFKKNIPVTCTDTEYKIKNIFKRLNSTFQERSEKKKY